MITDCPVCGASGTCADECPERFAERPDAARMVADFIDRRRTLVEEVAAGLRRADEGKKN